VYFLYRTLRIITFCLKCALWKRSYRNKITELYGILFQNNNKLPKSKIPQVDISELIHNDLNIKVSNLKTKDGNVSHLEHLAIALLVKHNKPKKIFEIGTFDGRSTLNMAINAPDAKIYTLDLPAEDIGNTSLEIHPWEEKYILKKKSGSRFTNKKLSNTINQLYGDSASFDFKDYLERMDFIFVDGSHMTEYVKNDTKWALKLRKSSKSTILWHDYGGDWQGVTEVMDKLYQENPVFKNLRRIKNTSLLILCD
jgi:hypothetical protein